MVEQIVIIGAGPAGLTCAIQLCRYGLQPVVLEAKQPGGLLHNANWVENYPGFPGGISGMDLIELFVQHAKSAGVKITRSPATNITYRDDQYWINTPDRTYYSEILVLASGTRPKRLSEIDAIPEVQSRVFYEVYPLIHENGKQFVIIGAGDAAFDYALNLSKHNQVTILNRNKNVRCLPLLWQRAIDNPGIQYFDQIQLLDGKNSIEGDLELTCEGKTGIFELRTDYLLCAIGRGPNLNFLSDDLRNQMDELISGNKLFVIGDVRNDIFRQTSIAAGDGMHAAMKIYQTIQE